MGEIETAVQDEIARMIAAAGDETQTAIEDMREKLASVAVEINAVTGELMARIESIERNCGQPQGGGYGSNLPIKRIDDDLIIGELDPTRPETCLPAPGRQVVIAGNMIDHRSPCDKINRGDGFGLCIENNEIHSWPMEDGDTLRWGIVGHGGRLCLANRKQFRLQDGYRVGDELALNRKPGHSDPLMHDGTRGQMDYEGHPLSFGDGRGGAGDDIIISFDMYGGPDVWQSGWRAAPISVHADWRVPKGSKVGGYSAPVTTSVRNGFLEVVERSSDQPIRYGVDKSPKPEVVARIPFVRDGWLRCILRMRTGADGIIGVWTLDGFGEMVEVFKEQGHVGYQFTPESRNSKGENPNGRAYAILGQDYTFHQYQPPEMGPHGEYPFNWDQSFGNIRSLYLASALVTSSADVTAEDHAAHLRFMHTATTLD